MPSMQRSVASGDVDEVAFFGVDGRVLADDYRAEDAPHGHVRDLADDRGVALLRGAAGEADAERRRVGVRARRPCILARSFAKAATTLDGATADLGTCMNCHLFLGRNVVRSVSCVDDRPVSSRPAQYASLSLVVAVTSADDVQPSTRRGSLTPSTRHSTVETHAIE